ncbi:MAG: TIGR00268 family protein, partial [Desulfobacterales bacterium]|nr:TIGR00268 family protein [Desulfobacterales bacterium]
YLCKKSMLEQVLKIAAENTIRHVAHGANLDDLNDYRPGFKAALEMGVIAPLMDAGLFKADIRTLSKAMNLETWDKPAMACLASRIPYHTPITPEILSMVERAEAILMDLGFKACRLRHHGPVARIEVPPDRITALLAEPIRKKIVRQLRKIGYFHVSLDLEGYVQGSLNRAESPAD